MATVLLAASIGVGCTVTPTGRVEIDPVVVCPPSEWVQVPDESLEGFHWEYAGDNPFCALVDSTQVGLYP